MRTDHARRRVVNGLMAAHTMLLPDLGRSDAQNIAFRHQRQQTNNPRKLYISLRGVFASAHTGANPRILW
ncbi:hypothetical protein EVA_04144 [gut metagenome]|uniref:Uncharacterized protein n=1 Tax=gut metagenome TaxID=749906 RepID=J9GKA0_9ZZZZ